MHTAVNLREKLASFEALWSPRVIGELNGQHVKLAKIKGEFVWHHHEHEDELFLVVKGNMRILFRDGEVALGEGDVYIVPHGVEHKPVADEETHLLLFEPARTRNTGNITNESTIEPGDLRRI